jgi:hypothetical protein
VEGAARCRDRRPRYSALRCGRSRSAS